MLCSRLLASTIPMLDLQSIPTQVRSTDPCGTGKKEITVRCSPLPFRYKTADVDKSQGVGTQQQVLYPHVAWAWNDEKQLNGHMVCSAL